MKTEDKIRIAVLGSRGMLGTDVVNTLINLPNYNVCGFDRSCDITNQESLSKEMRNFRPNWIVNAAAYNQVDVAEKNPQEAFRINEDGPRNIAAIANELKCYFVHVSTDYVFPGSEKAWKETDKPNPINLYGKSKWKGELAVEECQRHYILRTSTLYGLNRDNHALKLLESLKTQKSLRLAYDLVCSPTYTGWLAEQIGVVIQKKPAFGIYHVVNSGWVDRYHFARKLAELVNSKNFNADKISIEELDLPAKRPHPIKLSSEKWKKVAGSVLSWEKAAELFLIEAGFLKNVTQR